MQRPRTPRELWDAMVSAGAEPHKVDGIVVTYRIADRKLVEEFRDAVLAHAVRSER